MLKYIQWGVLVPERQEKLEVPLKIDEVKKTYGLSVIDVSILDNHKIF